MTKEYLSFVKESGQDGFEFVDDSNAHLFVGALSKVNMLVGANNSRKTRFMRMLVGRDVLPTIQENQLQAFEKGVATLDQLIAAIGDDEFLNVQTINEDQTDPPNWFIAFKNYNVKERHEKIALHHATLSDRDGRLILDMEEFVRMKSILCQLMTMLGDRTTIGSDSLFHRHADFFELLYQNQHITARHDDQGNNRICFDLMWRHKDLFLDLSQSYRTLIKSDGRELARLRATFIPSMRGSLPLFGDNEGKERLTIAAYECSTNALHFQRSVSNTFAIAAGDRLHSSILHDRNSTFERRERFQQFQGFIGHSFFGGKRVEVVATPDAQKQMIRVYIQDEEERELKDLGDGIQHLLILLYPIFMAEEGTWVFIDEPELSLHPGFQNLFLNTILNNPDLKAKNLRYFMTTHSNHFLSHALRSPDEVSVFSFSRHNMDQSIIRCVHGGDTTVLDQLGVENASVYMANCSIWVEGVSDRRYLQAFLKAYCQQKNEDGSALFPEFKEGLDYTFFEYAGTNLTHYLFDPDEDDPNLIDSFKNANRIFLLADQDAGKDTKHNQLRSLKSDNFEYHTTGTREIENILPPFVYQDFIASYPSQENLTFSATHQDYADQPMGGFLRNHIGEEALKYGEKTLTTKYKNDLSELVQDKSYTWAQFSKSDDIIRITKAVYDFIQRHNTSRN